MTEEEIQENAKKSKKLYIHLKFLEKIVNHEFRFINLEIMNLEFKRKI
ncbi:MAG: hypothetical protein V8R82_06625 [Clostridia bacterium]